MALGKPSRRPATPLASWPTRSRTASRWASLSVPGRAVGSGVSRHSSSNSMVTRAQRAARVGSPSGRSDDASDSRPPSNSPTASSKPPTAPVPGRAGTLPTAVGQVGWPGRPQGSVVSGW